MACLQTVSRDMRAACNTELDAYNPNRMAIRELTNVRQVPDTDPLCYLAQAITACSHEPAYQPRSAELEQPRFPTRSAAPKPRKDAF